MGDLGFKRVKFGVIGIKIFQKKIYFHFPYEILRKVIKISDKKLFAFKRYLEKIDGGGIRPPLPQIGLKHFEG